MPVSNSKPQCKANFGQKGRQAGNEQGSCSSVIRPVRGWAVPVGGKHVWASTRQSSLHPLGTNVAVGLPCLLDTITPVLCSGFPNYFLQGLAPVLRAGKPLLPSHLSLKVLVCWDSLGSLHDTLVLYSGSFISPPPSLMDTVAGTLFPGFPLGNFCHCVCPVLPRCRNSQGLLLCGSTGPLKPDRPPETASILQDQSLSLPQAHPHLHNSTAFLVPHRQPWRALNRRLSVCMHSTKPCLS